MNWGDLAVRASGLAGHLLDERALAEVDAAPDAATLAVVLSRAGWTPTAGGGPEAIERVARRRAGEDLLLLTRWAGARRDALAVLLEDQDRRSLRALVRGMVAAAPPSARVAAATPTPRLPEEVLQALAEATSPAAMAALLARLDHPYAADLAGGRGPTDLLALELALARRFAARARTARRTAPALATYVSQVIDGDNAGAALLLSARGEGMDVAACFIDGGDRLGRDDFEAAAAAATDEARTRLAAVFTGTPLAAAMPSPDPAAVEEATLAWQLDTQQRLRRRDPAGPASVVALLLRRRREVRRVRRAAWRIALGGPP